MTFQPAILVYSVVIALGLGPCAITYAVGRRFGGLMALIVAVEVGFFSVGLLTLARLGFSLHPPQGWSFFSMYLVQGIATILIGVCWMPMALVAGFLGAVRRTRYASALEKLNGTRSDHLRT